MQTVLIVIHLMVVVALVSGVLGLGTALSGPASDWAEKLPHSYPQLQERLDFLRKPVQKTQKLLVQAEDMTKAAESRNVATSG